MAWVAEAGVVASSRTRPTSQAEKYYKHLTLHSFLHNVYMYISHAVNRTQNRVEFQKKWKYFFPLQNVVILVSMVLSDCNTMCFGGKIRKTSR